MTAVPEDSDLDLEYQEVEPIEGLTERERRFGEAMFEVSLTHGDDSSALLLAYRRAFPLANNPDRAAKMLARTLAVHPRVRLLIARFHQKLAVRRSLPAERVIQELERIAYSNILDYFTTGEAGTGDSSERSPTQFDLLRLTPSTAAAVREVSITEEVLRMGGNGKDEVVRRHFQVKLYDKLSALDKLAQYHNLLRDRRFSLEELDRLIREMEYQLEDRGSAVAVIGGKQHVDRSLVPGPDSSEHGGTGQGEPDA